ncbi:OLC1v1020258C1 [Oldenlandia corymbosa var. corymbosa]|uniref:OLC1v1020258C1 n=1 Tax=Oldenlandia corymbosa var. corymbosa TaxID=529605 RepID=A0AAV1EG12_OLDCO|nr:OLC1v1020258C1 [Oldenlandia corymbosa var. corymbosa]
MATQTQTSATTSYSSSSGPSNTSITLTGLGNLIRLLPTGTVFFYQFMNPILTNNGSCSSTNKIFSSLLFAVCGLSCFFSTFTDSYKDDQGNLHYGIATFKGFWPTSSDPSSTTSIDFKSYRLQVGDFVHALLSLIVFCVLSLLDNNTVHCFYPSFESSEKALMMALPPVIGSVAGAVFTTFPMRRRGVGYAESSSSSSSSSSNAGTVKPAASSGQQTPAQNV